MTLVADRVEEIVIENRNRATSIVLCLFGLVLVGSFLSLLIYGFATKFTVFFSFESFVMLVLGLAFLSLLLWALYSLTRNSKYLETQPEGIVFGGRVRCFCTWDNIKDIQLVPYELYSRGGRVGMFYAVTIDFHSSDELYFDSAIDRMLARKAISDDQLKLYLRNVTSLSPEQVCSRLRERWKQASPASRAIASIPVVEDSKAELPDEIRVTRNDGKMKILLLCLLVLFAVVVKMALTHPDGVNWGMLLICLFGMGTAFWTLAIILPGKPLLETSPVGVALCGETGRCFVPWNNIKGITSVADRWQRYTTFPSRFPDRRIKFEFYDKQTVHYDNLIYRMVGKLLGSSFTINPIGGEANVSTGLIEALEARLERARSILNSEHPKESL
ncbi:hypothetical protein [Pseudodesulfovibrio portus]|uniref:DUF304 domain-containing protein n=1 Tax=Pseudodesulfovibrio portus TaxID=231439 RepID=A0ABN6RQC4_9BACT|nr:hypothetical protein [Pseudodesulfovibrio portus]BDQ33054.1 hypothetical protein JCM14722_05960 [Pseudodesulfovibrio portus]